jgi:hypothetical protein
MAKTHLSLSHDPTVTGAPTDFTPQNQPDSGPSAVRDFHAETLAHDKFKILEK